MSNSNGHFIHNTISGDRWDLLAYRYYGDPNKQTQLINANRALFLDPLVVPPLILPAGLTLIVPILEADPVDDAGLPPWKRANPDYGTAS